jgi:hypothetical protein
MSTTTDVPTKPFISLYDRHRYIARVDKSLVQSDPKYYFPLLLPGKAGREAYIAAMGDIYGCGTKYQPSDLEFAAFVCDVALEKDVDYLVSMHCDQCFKCQMILMRMAYHNVSDLPGTEWSAEVAAQYPMLVKSWENEKFHFRVFLKSIKSGPSFHVYNMPFSKDKKQLIIGSSAGIFGSGNFPLQDLVKSTQQSMEKRAKQQMNFFQQIDPVLISEFARRLGFDIDVELYDFLLPYMPGKKS